MSRTRRFTLLGIAAAIATFFVWQSVRWSGAAGAERAQRKFLSHIEDRDWSKCRGMFSSSYSDRWEFDREEATLALRDVGSVFVFVLVLEWKTESVSEEQADGSFDVVGTLEIDGRGGPGTEIVLRTTRGFATEPMTFRWKREGLMPWKWKLLAIDHPSVEVPPGYTPGELRSSAAAGF